MIDTRRHMFHLQYLMHHFNLRTDPVFLMFKFVKKDDLENQNYLNINPSIILQI